MQIGVFDLVSQNCFDFSFDWMRPCVLYLLLSKWGWLEVMEFGVGLREGGCVIF